MGQPRKKQKTERRPWQDIAQEAQEYRDASISRVSAVPELPEDLVASSRLPQVSLGIPDKVLDARDAQITNCLPEELAHLLAGGQLSAVEVTLAYLRRAALAQKLTNCITELLPERAINRARFLDNYLAEHKRPIGPCHGLPVSVKEMIGMKDLGLNAGYIAWWGRIAEEDAHVLQILWDAGAIFYARTTEPQSMMHLETDSNLYGVTVNPYNRDLTSGGSSGGEGALISMRGSCLGLGSDIGGSIRSPAANCGIYGLKPTAFRIPTDGWSSTMVGADAIPGVIGPMSTSLEGIKLFMETVLKSQPWLAEPALIPLPWDTTLRFGPEQPLKIGVMWHDGTVMPHPPITRALRALVAQLQTCPNIEVIEWTPHQHDEGWAILSSLYFPDGGASDAAIIDAAGEPWRPLTAHIIRDNPCANNLSPREIDYWLEEREAYRKEYATAWNSTAHLASIPANNSKTKPKANTKAKPPNSPPGRPIDVLLCPVGPGVAPRHNTARYWGYTALWNLLDYPALTFPVTKVGADDEISHNPYKPMNELDAENWKLYTDGPPHIFQGLPISLQLVGRRFQDEKVVSVLEHIKRKIDLPFVKFP